MNSYFFNITEEERESILNMQKQPYNGWVQQQPKYDNMPLYVEDVAKDKDGFTLTNEDLTECNECSSDESICSECGGQMEEGICEACGYSDNEKTEDDDKLTESITSIKNFMNRVNII